MKVRDPATPDPLAEAGDCNPHQSECTEVQLKENAPAGPSDHDQGESSRADADARPFSLNSHFSRVFVINMDEATDRLAECSSEFLGVGSSFERVRATTGSQVRRDSDRMQNSVSWLGRNMATDAMLGCSFSHRQLWERVVSQELQCALICEDDVRFIPGAAFRIGAIIMRLGPAHYERPI